MPFTLGSIILLLQVYIMEKAPYTVLLGCSFDSITESKVINDREGNQTVCITCLNTGIMVAVPIYKREELPRKVNTLSNFQ